MNRQLVFELATARFVSQCEDALLLGPPGTGKSHIAQALGLVAIQQGHRVLYREAHVLIEELADATLDGSRKERLQELATVSLLILDDLGMRSSPRPPPRTCSNSSCAATSGPARSSPPTGPSTTGGACSATPRPSPPCSIGSSITPTWSSAGPGAGARGSPPWRAPRPRAKQPRSGPLRWPALRRRRMAGSQTSTEGILAWPRDFQSELPCDDLRCFPRAELTQRVV